MERNFHDALAAVLKHEGGWADHPRDPGGATMKGVTLTSFRKYVKPKATKNDLRKISDEQIETVYRRHYWDAVRGNELPPGVDYSMFDFGVNSGPSWSIKFVQKIVGVAQDGRIGPVTLAAIHSVPAKELVARLCDDRLSWLKGLRTWRTFGKGWGRRVRDVKSVALKLAEQGPDSQSPPIEVDLSNLTYVNQNAIRNRPCVPELVLDISAAILVVFGSGYRGEIYSGGQPRKGGRRTGSIRHDDFGSGGRGADVYVYDPQNRKLTQLELARLGQYWLAKQLGGCGLEMNKGGIHLDNWKTPPKGGGMLWTYAYSDSQSWGDDIRRMLIAGADGVMPELAPPDPKLAEVSATSQSVNKKTVGLLVVAGALASAAMEKTSGWLSSSLEWIGGMF